MSILLSYLFYFVAASASPLQRRWLAVKKAADSRSQVRFAFQVSIVVSLLSLLLPFFSPFHISGNIWVIMGLTLLSSAFGAVVVVGIYVAQKHVEAGVSSLLSNVYTPSTIIFASIFLREGLSLMQIAGTILLLVGLVVVSKKHQTGRFTFDKYFWLMLASGAMLSVLLVAQRALIKITGFTAGSMLEWWAETLILGFMTLAVPSKNTYTAKEVTVTGSLRFLQTLSWLVLVTVVGNLSLVSSITTFKVVVIFIAAFVFLRERDHVLRKIVGSLIAIGGLLLMR